jgi:predicted Fe-S protein YdhL (DUF1289 family)
MGFIHSNNASIESPCIGVCTLDDSGYCMGCRRTAAEIAAWLEMSPKLQQELLIELESRPLFA